VTQTAPSSLRAFILGLFSLFLASGFSNAAFAASRANAQAPAPNSANFQAWLTREVRQQLVTLPFYTVFDNLTYRVEGDKVILMGQATKPSLKSDAGKAVKSIEGVAAVDNQIEVLPPSNQDDRLRRALYRAIYSFPTLQMYALRSVPPIHIIVKSGQVTLEGSVASEADKTAANVRANTVPGVFSVTNNLRVDGGTK
jgi:hyperosmotically inducible protein